MGFRYRRSIKILPGVRVNFNKKSTSVTFGGKRYKTTVNNSTGTITSSAKTPVKGLYYSERIGGQKNATPQNAPIKREHSPKVYRVCGYLMIVLAVLTVLVFIPLFPVGLVVLPIAYLMYRVGRRWIERGKAN